MNIETGGPAFPQTLAADATGNLRSSDEPGQGRCGMDLRDWFAGQSIVAIHLQSMLAMHMESPANPNRDDIAVEAYRQADAMLTARMIGTPSQ